MGDSDAEENKDVSIQRRVAFMWRESANIAIYRHSDFAMEDYSFFHWRGPVIR